MALSILQEIVADSKCNRSTVLRLISLQGPPCWRDIFNLHTTKSSFAHSVNNEHFLGSKLTTTADTPLDTCFFTSVSVTLVGADFADGSLTLDERLSVLLTLLHTRVAVKFVLVWHKASVLQNGSIDRTFTW